MSYVGIVDYDLVVEVLFFFFFQAEDGIRDYKVTGVQTCALPIYANSSATRFFPGLTRARGIASASISAPTRLSSQMCSRSVESPSLTSIMAEATDRKSVV